MTRADLAERISERRKISSSQAELLVNTIFDCMEQSIRRSEKIEIRYPSGGARRASDGRLA